ncbi:MAG: PTS fructose transporter subunit IIA [Rhodospirillaceae bacterium]|nr:PTS fructose transporter subunit IIA [Rhodospirillaceae bacterium]OUT76096.1 MAG: PTS fructose transporter subunit IIA [Rhodospirillaceae bacterium TMED23]|tara:strand:+ start:163 stop:564 length:402 start_codon:yes stop_codon:yes gene_type:complete
MIGLVLVTHGYLAIELIKALEHVVGPQAGIASVCIGPNDDMEIRRQDIITAVSRVYTNSGVIILTDMFGGTPSNLAMSVLDSNKIEIISGVNLPMLIKFASCRKECVFEDCVEKSQEAGRKYINVVSKLIKKD